MSSVTVLVRRFTLAVFLAASCNLVWQFYRLILDSIERERLSRETGWTLCHFGPPPDFKSRFLLECFLFIAWMGSRAKGLNYTLLNVVGLTGAVITYIFWWQIIFRISENAGTSLEAIDNFMYLVGGTPLDVAIDLAVNLLVVLNVGVAARSFFELDSPSKHWS